jgi:hypothetical protein
MTKEYKGFANIESEEEIIVRRVLIGTPALDGKVQAWYTDSLCNSIKLCAANGIDLQPVILIDESILPMARNELLNIAYQDNFESIVFIDSDQVWDAKALLDVINSQHDVIGLPVVSKTDQPGNFNVKLQGIDQIQKDEKGNIKVNAVGTGFLKLSRKALEALWNSNPTTIFRGKELKLICEYATSYNEFIGEDIYLCNKLKELEFDIWVNPNSTCAHIGNKVWMGDFAHFLEFLTSQKPEDIKE